MSAYRVEVPADGITFEVDRLRRDRHELVGELVVYCQLPNAKTVNGILNAADFNFSSLRARQDRAKALGERARTNGSVDWLSHLEELCQGVISRERAGDPAVDLRTLERPGLDAIHVCGFVFPRRHPAILFGDGASGKSYIALWIAGELVNAGLNVALFDWELAGEDHRDRLERIFGPVMPKVFYCRCERPLIYEADRLRRIVNDHKIDYSIYDSVAFACDGPPESAEIAGKYFRALREIDSGSLHVAHQTKGESGDKKPFGSVFWFNGARSIWHVQASERIDESSSLQLGFTPRKANLGPFPKPLGYRLEFTDERTTFVSESIEDNPDAAMRLSIRQRMHFILRRGSVTLDDIASQLECPVGTVERTARRYRNEFILLSGGRVGLVER